MCVMFAVLFLAINTANLATYTITREEFHDFSSLSDTRVHEERAVEGLGKFGSEGNLCGGLGKVGISGEHKRKSGEWRERLGSER